MADIIIDGVFQNVPFPKIKNYGEIYANAQRDHWQKTLIPIIEAHPDVNNLATILSAAIAAITSKACLNNSIYVINRVEHLLEKGEDKMLELEFQALYSKKVKT